MRRKSIAFPLIHSVATGCYGCVRGRRRRALDCRGSRDGLVTSAALSAATRGRVGACARRLSVVEPALLLSSCQRTDAFTGIAPSQRRQKTAGGAIHSPFFLCKLHMQIPTHLAE